MKHVAALALLLVSAPVGAEVVSASSNGLEVRHIVDVPVSPDAAYAAFGKVGSWWSGEHTYSGNAANLSLTLEPGGCWCERLPNGGGVRHMEVVLVEPGKHVILTGGLGPLLSLATTGVLDVQVKPTAKGSQVTFDYRAAGFFKGGADKIAPAVDGVIGEQVKRYAASVSR